MLLIISDIFLGIIGLVALILGSIQDIKEREVYDLVSYTVIAIAVLIRAYYIINTGNLMYGIAPAISFGIALIFSLLMYYGNQWGGGDVKILLAISLIIGSQPSFLYSSQVNKVLSLFSNSTYLYATSFFISFMILSLFSGVIVGLIFAVYIAIKNRRFLKKEIKSVLKKYKIVFLIFVITTFLFLIGFMITNSGEYLLFAIIMITLLILVPFVSAVENLMFKIIPPSKLTEGDWIAEDIYVKKKKIYSKTQPGVSLKQISELKKLYKEKKIKKVKVKEGFPFIPAFLIAYILVYLIYMI